MSSEPPPVRNCGGIGSCTPDGCVRRPVASERPQSLCTARASRSASLHSGIPTFSMFAPAASATGRFMCCGQAEPSSVSGSILVPVCLAAPSAASRAMSHSS